MGDNLNANGAAPVAPYVFLSFLFEIAQCNPLSKHVETSMQDLALLEYRA